MLLDAAPQRRGLASENTAKGVVYWTFPADFGERVLRLVVPVAPGAPGPAGPVAALAPR